MSIQRACSEITFLRVELRVASAGLLACMLDKRAELLAATSVDVEVPSTQ